MLETLYGLHLPIVAAGCAQSAKPASKTIPGKGWNVLWRIYGPLEAWYDKSWRPSEIDLVE